MELLKSIQKEIAENNKANKESFYALRESMSSVTVSLEEIKTKLVAVEEENKNLKQECASLRGKNEFLENQVLKIRQEMVELQQYSRNKNIEIKGIPVTNGENIYAILETVAKKLER